MYKERPVGRWVDQLANNVLCGWVITGPFSIAAILCHYCCEEVLTVGIQDHAVAGIQGHAMAEAPTGVARALLYVHSQGLSLLSSLSYPSINQSFLSYLSSLTRNNRGSEVGGLIDQVMRGQA